MNANPDTLSFAKKLEASGMDRQTAEAIAEGARDMMTDELATKSDLANMRADLSRTIYVSSLGTIALLFALLRFTT